MVDVDRRPPLPHGLPRPPSHAAGLRRLSTRASAPTTPRASPATPSPSSAAAAAPSPSALVAHLAAAGVSVLPGLSDPELAHAEAALGGLQLPPDLRDLLAIGVPSGDGFPDYRSPAGLRLLRFAAEEVPAAVAAALPGRRAGGRGRWCSSSPPPLVPLYGRHYVPAVPCLAGNPVFHVSDTGVAVAGANIAAFLLRAFAAEPPRGAPLRRQLSAPMPPPAPSPAPSTARRSLDSATGKAPRWIEFWTDAAAAGDRFVEVSTCTSTRANAAPQWVRSYLEWAGSVLRRGGWGGGEVEEMTTGSGGGGEEAVALALTVDRCCGELGRAGWGAEEVVEALGALLGPRTRKRPAVALPPDVAARVGRLAEAVSRAVFTGSGSGSGGNPEPAKRPF
ncbi:uncharacterized protein [Oryza sativa Japonica Group]|uniref:Expressed protein n=2 Tax=Oryza sativa subsp. japonica TaxID=39947 RepID=Q94LG6_ORYSJ|nr:guanine nucleotide-binding protein G(s) subunit alpha isoforms XLas [Oryza sativa Japonica Group]KAB8092095.1 hypothetical protein EE612_017887 [Oryza sativa]AAK52567.1 Unknown protein [Oryza sativa Japonica Group]ABF96421.1 expressed protein [Oryza sativa Japonica Group]KAF2939581.1 hypothetical protein DAI22_03g206400 [Oryza sativa Japonica Group]BAF12210.1 Os03g0396000 [Oryza sativa Japonica Group]|eukprot:NP_001050296.1 Os03g0396000 [Oryza sativa Japonica Group]